MKTLVFFICLLQVCATGLAQCPPGVKLEECEIDPCEFASCTGHDDATCVANYCGGCIADFYENGEKVTCDETKRAKRSEGQCPPGVKLEECEIDPCDYASCPGHEDATCVANYCGGCIADFYENGAKVTCGSSTFSKRSIKECPDEDKRRCFVDPCFTESCPAFPEAACKANYCEECHADFFDKEGNLVDCDEQVESAKAAKRTMLTRDEEIDAARNGASRPRLFEL